MVYTKKYIKVYDSDLSKVKRDIYQKDYWKKHPQKHSDITGRYFMRLRINVLEYLGNKCIKCGFSDARALQIDHIKGGGSLDNKTRNNRYRLLKDVLEDKGKKYQLLCANCNWIKRSENKEMGKKFINLVRKNMQELKSRNLQIVKEKMSGKTVAELATAYKTSVTNIRRIIVDTKNKYPEVINSTN